MGRGHLRQFQSGLVWNYMSTAVLAVSGLAFNFLIAIFYTPESLGLFNRVYAYYILFSQVAVFGLQNSVMRYVAKYCHSKKTYIVIFNSSIVATLISSTLTALLIYGILNIIETFLRSDIIHSLKYILPSLVFFSFNKVFLGYFNALSHMRAYAVLQALRNIFIALSIAIMAILKIPGNKLVICFLLAEFAIFILCLSYVFFAGIAGRGLSFEWIKKHFAFGVKIFPSNMVLEFNTRVDIICLGFFMPDNMIGIYSFVILFAEGFYQMFVVIRRNLNPFIPVQYINGAMDSTFDMLKTKIKNKLKLFTVPFVILLIVGYFAICLFLNNPLYYLGIPSFVILVVAIAINGLYIAYGNILSQAGYPKYESVVNIITVCSNFFLNLALIPLFGIVGAAIATGLSYCVFSLSLKRYASLYLNLIF